MSDETTQEAPEAPEAPAMEAQEQATSLPEPPASVQTSVPETEEEDGLGDAGKRALQRLRAEIKASAKRIHDLEAQNAKIAQENLTHRVTNIATAKMEYPALAAKLIDAHAGMSDGEIARAIDDLVESMPKLAKAERSTGSVAFTLGSKPENQHAVNAQLFAGLVNDQLNR